MAFVGKLQQEIRETASKSGSFAELLSYAFLYNENTILHKDLSFSAHFQYTAQDVDSSTGVILDANAAAVMQALSVLGNGWVVETNLLSQEDRQYSDPRAFPDRVSALIDDARRQSFMQLKTFFTSTSYLSLTYTPVDVAGKKLSKLLVEEREEQSFIEKEHRRFEQTVESFLTQWGKICFGGMLTRLGGTELITFLYRCITSGWQKLVAPQTGYFLDTYLSGENFVSGLVPMMGNKYIKVLSLDDLPEYSYPAILDELNYQGFEYRWASRFIALSKESAAGYLKHIRVQWGNKAIGFLGVIKQVMGLPVRLDDLSSEYAEDTAAALKENNEGVVRFGFFNSVVVLMYEDEKELDDAVRAIRKVIEGLNYKVRIEDFNATEAYLGSLPGHGTYNTRAQIIDSVYVSHALPTSSVWQGSESAPCPFYPPGSPALLYTRTQGSRKFSFNVHVGDVGHFVILGPTGTGKSTLLGLIGVQFRKYPNSRIIVFDKDYSNKMWIQSLGGNYMDIYGGTSIAPFIELTRLEESSPEFQAELTFAVDWLADICSLQNVEITPERRQLLKNSLLALVHLNEEEKRGLQLDNLHVQDNDIRIAIEAFNSGAISLMVNGLVDNFGQSDVLGLESSGLLKLKPELYVPVIKAIFHRLERLFKDKRPTLLILEEAWSFLRHKIFEDMLEDWLLTLRKFNVSVGFISQNLEHVTASKISGTIKESCQTKVFLPNKSILDESITKKYYDFGLNEQQIAILASATPKQDYYIASTSGNRLFQLDLDRLTLAFLDAGSEDDKKEFTKIYNSKKDTWILDWLEYKKLPGWVNYVRDVYFEQDREGGME